MQIGDKPLAAIRTAMHLPRVRSVLSLAGQRPRRVPSNGRAPLKRGLLLAALLFGLWAPAASAQKGTIGIIPELANGVAVNQSNGNVYLVANDQVQVYDPDGNSLFSFGGPGTQGGQFEFPTGIAIDEATGNVFVGDSVNARIQEFDSSGAFIRAWGWGVTSEVDEQQTVAVSATGGTFTLTFEGSETITTEPIPFDASAAEVQSAISRIPATVSGGPGDATGSTPYVFTFDGREARGTDVPQMTADGNSLTGAAASATVATTVNGSSSLQVCTVASECHAGTLGSGSGQLVGPSGVAVSNSTVYVADGARVKEFTTAGAFIREFGKSRCDAANYSLVAEAECPFVPDEFDLGDPVGLAVDNAGNVYTTGSLTAQGASVVRKFTSTGEFLNLVEPVSGRAQETNGSTAELYGQSPVGVAVDALDNHVLVSDLNHVIPLGGNIFSDPTLKWQVAELDASANPLEIDAVGLPLARLGLAMNDASGRIYAATNEGVFIIDNLTNVPSAAISPATEVSADSATLQGEVNPNGAPLPGASTGYHFEYRAEGEPTWTSIPSPDTDVGSGEGEVAVTQALAGLDPNTTYRARLVATRLLGAGLTVSGETTFTTAALPPVVEGRSAYPVLDTSAVLRGVIDAKHSATTYWFEYGTGPGYGASAPVARDGDAGAGLGAKAVFAEVEDLAPETTYHYRLVAHNQSGTTSGPDMTFTTVASMSLAWPGRGIELVSSPEKANQPAAPHAFDDNHMIWQSTVGGPSGDLNFLLATRTASGWQSTSMLPPANQLPGSGRASSPYTMLGVADDFSHAVVFLKPEGAGGVDQAIVKVDAQGHVTSLLSLPAGSTEAGGIGVNLNTARVSPDLRHVVLSVGVRLDPSAPPKVAPLYDIGSGTPTIVSRNPGGAVLPCSLKEKHPGDGEFPGLALSTDPDSDSYLFFPGCSDEIYRRDLDTNRTVLIAHGVFLAASADGQTVLFTTTAQLAPDDQNTDLDVYRHTAAGGNECLTCVVADANPEEIIVSKDLSHIYFTSPNQLVVGKGQAGGAATNLYVLRHGQIGYISPYSKGSNALESAPSTQVTPSGNDLFFNNDARGITPDDPGTCGSAPCGQVYRYDDPTGALECVTCLPQGAPNTTDGAELGSGALSTEPGVSAISEDGSTFVFTSMEAYVPQDVNNSHDIYEWHDGRYRLITDGVTQWSPEAGTPFSGNPYLYGITPDGTNVFFTEGARLTGYEVDQTSQLYDARVGGGFPAPPPVPAPCSEDACQGPLQAPPLLESPGSASFAGPGNQTPNEGAGLHKQTRRKQTHHKTHRKSKKAHRKSHRSGHRTVRRKVRRHA